MSTGSHEAAVGMENRPIHSLPIDLLNLLTTTTPSSDIEKRPESCLQSANSLQASSSSSSLTVFSMESPTSTAIGPATNQSIDNLLQENNHQITIDTKEVCKRIACELSQHSISQRLFAKKILNKSQGALSVLLNNPKPWKNLRSPGRDAFLSMFNWLKQPLQTRLRVLDMVPDELENETSDTATFDAAAAATALFARERSSVTDEFLSATRRSRSVLTPMQKETLEEIFKHTRHPSREKQMQIAQHLMLDLPKVTKYFMNARHRMRKADEHAAVAVSPGELQQQLEAANNDHATDCKAQEAAEMESDN